MDARHLKRIFLIVDGIVTLKNRISLQEFGFFLLAMLIASIGANAQPAVAPAKAGKLDSAKTGANSEPLEVILHRRKVVFADGRETTQSAAIARPGDILEEVVTYTNNSGTPIRGLEATLPVPANTEVLIGFVWPGNAKASTDGSQFSVLPLTRKVRQVDGIEITQPIPASEYRYLRWYPGELAAGKSLVFSARFKVSNESAVSLPVGK